MAIDADGDFSPGAMTDAGDEHSTLATSLLTDSSRIGRDSGGGIAQIATGVASRQVSAKPMSNASAAFVAMCFEIQFAVGTDLLPGDQIETDSRLYSVEETDEGLTGATVLTAYVYRSRSAATW